MGLFDLFRKKRELTDDEPKWNKMWDLWADGKIASPYAELMTYQSEVNNGGHDQYFLNVGNTGSIGNEMTMLEKLLPARLYSNLTDAYRAYQALEENEDDEKAAETLEKCDDFFYENEEEINQILEKHSSQISL